MCRSLAEGGQRCAAHTRAAYTRALHGDPSAIATAAADYASTDEGHEHFASKMRLACGLDTDDQTPLEVLAEKNPVAADLHRHIVEGQSRRQMHSEVREQVRGAKGEWSDTPTESEIRGYLSRSRQLRSLTRTYEAQAQMYQALDEFNTAETDPSKRIGAVRVEADPKAGPGEITIAEVKVDHEVVTLDPDRASALKARLSKAAALSPADVSSLRDRGGMDVFAGMDFHAQIMARKARESIDALAANERAAEGVHADRSNPWRPDGPPRSTLA